MRESASVALATSPAALKFVAHVRLSRNRTCVDHEELIHPLFPLVTGSVAPVSVHLERAARGCDERMRAASQQRCGQADPEGTRFSISGISHEEDKSSAARCVAPFQPGVLPSGVCRSGSSGQPAYWSVLNFAVSFALLLGLVIVERSSR